MQNIFTVGIWCCFGTMYFLEDLGHKIALAPPPLWVAGFACLSYAWSIATQKSGEP